MQPELLLDIKVPYTVSESLALTKEPQVVWHIPNVKLHYATVQAEGQSALFEGSCGHFNIYKLLISDKSKTLHFAPNSPVLVEFSSLLIWLR